MSATASPPQDRVVSQPEREIVYIARREDLRLVHTPTYPLYGAGGRKLGEERGISVQFRHGILRLPMEGTVKTENGMKIDAAELNAWLGEHHLFGDTFEGFTKLEQVAPPVSGMEMTTAMEATARYDVEGLEALLEQERAGWNRPALIEAVERGLATIAQVQAQVQAQVEAAEAEKAAAKKPARD